MLELNCKQSLNDLIIKNRITLCWVPGHERIEVNEIADILAKKCAKVFFLSPESYCGLEKAHLASEIYEWGKAEKNPTGNKFRTNRSIGLS